MSKEKLMLQLQKRSVPHRSALADEMKTAAPCESQRQELLPGKFSIGCVLNNEKAG